MPIFTLSLIVLTMAIWHVVNQIRNKRRDNRPKVIYSQGIAKTAHPDWKAPSFNAWIWYLTTCGLEFKTTPRNQAKENHFRKLTSR